MGCREPPALPASVLEGSVMPEYEKSRVTMEDVARAAGVSQSTVSFVINKVPDVRIGQETRDRVLTIARELGYAPRRRLKRRPGRPRQAIGMLVDEVATSPFAAQSIEGAQEEANAAGRMLFVAMTGGDEAYATSVVQSWIEAGIEGVIFASILTRRVRLPPLLEQPTAPLPTVLLNCEAERAHLAAVLPDEEMGGFLAARTLIDAGHRRIGFINGEPWMRASRLRRQGLVEALHAAGIDQDPDLLRTGNFMPSTGYAETVALMQRANPPSAIFCANDLMAVGCYQALAQLGFRVPEDVAVIGYDDQEIARHLVPPLSSVNLPHREMGRWAVQTLLDPDLAASDPGTTLLPCRPVIRQSVQGAETTGIGPRPGP